MQALDRLGLSLLPPAAERLCSLNAVRVPDGVDDARVRRALLERHGIEIGAGRGRWPARFRIGLMGTGATLDSVARASAALQQSLQG